MESIIKNNETLVIEELNKLRHAIYRDNLYSGNIHSMYLINKGLDVLKEATKIVEKYENDKKYINQYDSYLNYDPFKMN